MPKTKQAAQDNEQPWTQRTDENELWYGRFEQFLALGPRRSVRGVYAAERGLDRSVSVPSSWSDAAKKYDWLGRAAAYDADRRKAIFSKGNAADTERVSKLDVLIEKLHERALTMLKNAPPEEAFNDKLLAQLLSAIDAMAKLTGSSVQRVELTGKDGKAIEIDEETTMKVVFYAPEVTPLDFDATQLLDGDASPAALPQGES